MYCKTFIAELYIKRLPFFFAIFILPYHTCNRLSVSDMITFLAMYLQIIPDNFRFVVDSAARKERNQKMVLPTHADLLQMVISQVVQRNLVMTEPT